MAVVSVVAKPDGEGGDWVLYWHDDQSAELWHRPRPGRGGRCVTGRAWLYEVRAAMRREGITEDGWTPA